MADEKKLSLADLGVGEVNPAQTPNVQKLEDGTEVSTITAPAVVDGPIKDENPNKWYSWWRSYYYGSSE